MPVDNEASLTDQAIYERIVEAVLDHRLPPGTRLTEDKLGSIFGVSRTRIKPILVRLANEKIITLTHNRGASVAQPTFEESQEIFETRRLIEPVLLRRFMAHAQAEDIAVLSRMVAEERMAQDQGDMHKAIGLSGEFHLYIAQKARHETMGRLLRGNTRAMDASCRMDENHFAVLLSGVGLATAHSRMEGLRRQCATQIVMLDGVELGFTVAMGVASFPHTAHGHEELVSACSAALGEARRRGGNTVALASIRFEGG
jgi:DNA-binding GntR family transcriptional regulator